MAVPPIERFEAVGLDGPASGARFSWLLDVILGLLIVAALPLAILAIPNTVSLVSGLLPPEFDRLDLIRAHGLALPAMMLTVPLASVLVQRMKAAPILLTGLAVLALADAAGGFAGSAFLVGVLRVIHGIGAGLLVPALLMAAWERAPLLRALWTGMLAVSLLAAQALALWPLDDVRDWRITLQPYPLLTGIALGLAAIYLALGVATGTTSTPGPRAIERTRLTLTAVPAAGLAVLAVGTTFGWPPGLVILAALFSLAALLTLASIGTFEGPAGRSLAYAMLAVGVVVLPTAAQVTYMELGGVGGPGLSGLWLPFLICALMGAGAALAVGVLDRASMQRLSRAGLVTIVVGLCAVRLMVPATDGFMLVVPFALLAVGAAVALTAALRMSGPGAALYGLSLCFPGVLAGYLLGTGVQMVLLGRPQSAQQLVDRFVEALHLWALIGGFLVVAVIALAALLGRRSAARASTSETDSVSETSREPDADSGADRGTGSGADRGGATGSVADRRSGTGSGADRETGTGLGADRELGTGSGADRGSRTGSRGGRQSGTGSGSETVYGAPGAGESTASASDALRAPTSEQATSRAVDSSRRERPEEFPVAGDGIAPEEPAGAPAKPSPTPQAEDAPTGEVPRVPASPAKPVQRTVSRDRGSSDGVSAGESRPGSSFEGGSPRKASHGVALSEGGSTDKPSHGATPSDGASLGNPSHGATSSKGGSTGKSSHGAAPSKGDSTVKPSHGAAPSESGSTVKPSHGAAPSKSGSTGKPSHGAIPFEGGSTGATPYGTTSSGGSSQATPVSASSEGGIPRKAERKDAADAGPTDDGAASDGAVRDGTAAGDVEAERPGEGTGPTPVVPPPTQSPEDSAAD